MSGSESRPSGGQQWGSPLVLQGTFWGGVPPQVPYLSVSRASVSGSRKCPLTEVPFWGGVPPLNGTFRSPDPRFQVPPNTSKVITVFGRIICFWCTRPAHKTRAQDKNTNMAEYRATGRPRTSRRHGSIANLILGNRFLQ